LKPISTLDDDDYDDRGRVGGCNRGAASVDVEAWADAVVQAAGDVMEQKFWGGWGLGKL
jgi:hypothetical protein